MREIRRLSVAFPQLDEKSAEIEAEYTNDPASFQPTFDDRLWREPRIIGTLLAMHGEVCAYCQGQLTPSDRGDVEHFRPKSVYWWLAYKYSNYLLSCSRCNRTRKGRKFPLAEGEPGIAFGDGRDLGDEGRLLLDPTIDHVEQLFKLKRMQKTWFLQPVTNQGVENPQAKQTIEFFELNLGKLPGTRQLLIAEAIDEAQRVRNGKGSRLKLKQMASRYRPFGVIIQRVLRRHYADLLPTVSDDIAFLIAELRIMLDTYDECLASCPEHKDTLALRTAALWALAAIWADPPPEVSPQIISKWLGNRWRPQVAALLDETE